MPEDGIRLDRIEQWQRTIDARLWGDGATVAYERSLEGRVAAMESTMRNVDALAEAARELRRSQVRAWSRWEKVGLFAFAACTATAAVISALSILLN